MPAGNQQQDPHAAAAAAAAAAQQQQQMLLMQQQQWAMAPQQPQHVHHMGGMAFMPMAGSMMPMGQCLPPPSTALPPMPPSDPSLSLLSTLPQHPCGDPAAAAAAAAAAAVQQQPAGAARGRKRGGAAGSSSPTTSTISVQRDAAINAAALAAMEQSGVLEEGDDPQKMVCQVPGCGKDLTGLKDYHQRYRICAVHIRLPQVRPNDVILLVSSGHMMVHVVLSWLLDSLSLGFILWMVSLRMIALATMLACRCAFAGCYLLQQSASPTT